MGCGFGKRSWQEGLGVDLREMEWAVVFLALLLLHTPQGNLTHNLTATSMQCLVLSPQILMVCEVIAPLRLTVFVLPLPALALLLTPISVHLLKGDVQLGHPCCSGCSFPSPDSWEANYTFSRQRSSPPQVHYVFISGPHYFCCFLPALPGPSLGALGCSMAGCLAMTRSSTEPFLTGSRYVHGHLRRPGLCPKAPKFSVQHFKIMIFKAQSVLSKTG